MKRFIATLLMLIAVAGCDLFVHVQPDSLPPETGPVSHKLQVVDFYATWCGPCMMQAPKIAMLEKDGYDIVKVNVDEHEDLAHEYNIHEVPTYVVLVNGEETYRTNQAWKLTEYLRKNHERPVQASKGRVSDLPKTRRQNRTGEATPSAEGTRTSASRSQTDVGRTAMPKTVETCLIRDRHLHINDRGLRPAGNAR